MNHLYNDTAYIAQSFQLSEEYNAQNAKLALFKINSYRLSFIKSSFGMSREELANNLNDSLLHYTSPDNVLDCLGFYHTEMDN